MGTTDDRNDPRLTHGADDTPVPQAEVYLVLSEAERAEGFIRPLRFEYWHLPCMSRTTISQDIAETYSRNPYFYGSTYCCQCRMHRPVGADGEFEWTDGDKVGT